MSIHLGELKDGGTHHFSFTTVDGTGLPTVFTGSPALRIYKDANTTQTTTGITLAADFNALVGLNMVTLVLTDGFYVAATDYHVVIEAGTVGGISVIGYVVAQFSISNRKMEGVVLVDTTTDNTDVAALNDVAATDIVSSGAITTSGGAVTTVTTTGTATNVTTVDGLAANVITAAATADDHIDLIWDELMAGHVTADTSGLVMNDWQDAGRLDAILDIIAADVVNLDGMATLAATDIVSSGAITTSGGSVTLVTTTTTVTDDVGITATAVDLVWDEPLTVGTHNVGDSSGRRLRALQEAGAYTFGHVFIDTVNGAAGTTDFENGVEINPSLTIADANTIATSVGLSRFAIAPASVITLAATQANQEFEGDNWTLDLSDESVSGSHFIGADVTGAGTGASEIHFEHCEIGTVTVSGAHFDFCDLTATLTLSAAATYTFIDCNHAGTVILDFGSGVGNTTVHMHGWRGAIEIQNMGQSASTDVLHFDSFGGQLTLNVNCLAGGTVNARGTFELIDNSTSTTVNRGGDIVNDVSDVPTVSEFNARTILSADYFDPAADTVALVTTTTGVTDRVTANTDQWAGGTIPAQGITGVPEVDVTHFVAELAPAPIITGVPDVNAVRILDVAPTLTNNDLDVNVAQIIGTAPTLTSTNIDVNIASTDDIALSATQKSDVNAEVVDVLKTDTVTLPGQVAPPLAPTFEEMISWLYKTLRNRKDQTATLWQLYADDESTVDAKATVSDDGTTAIKQEIEQGT